MENNLKESPICLVQELSGEIKPEIERNIGTAIPFLRWAGGKRWLVHTNSELFDLAFNRYIEPFAGSASVFFHLNPQRGTEPIPTISRNKGNLMFRIVRNNQQDRGVSKKQKIKV